MPVLKTTKKLWEDAQKIELDIWEREYRQGANNDWNNWWYNVFGGYKDIPTEICSAIELGCGPFTNIKWIIKIPLKILSIHQFRPSCFSYLLLV